jgi:low temperature requirement protein LtrA
MPKTGRRLIGTTILLQDWDRENEEPGEAQYWELFLDLLLVAAASAVAEGLQEDPTWLPGVSNFILLYLLVVNGWMLYTFHITTRFEDGSFLHSVILFVYVVGFAVTITNASVEETSIWALAVGALVQRLAIFVMMVIIYLDLPRARPFCVSFLRHLSVAMLCLAFAALWRSVAWLWAATLVETTLEVFQAFFSGLTRQQVVPLDIEHGKDRLGVLLLIMLGETVISSTIEYRRLARAHEIDDYAAYYWVLFWALVLVFFYNQLYFCMNPPIQQHAYRRSKGRGVALHLVHKAMCGSVLAVGTAVKLSIEAVVRREELTDFAVRLWSCSVGCSVLFLFGLRLIHYAGIYPTGLEPPDAIRLMYVWWGVIAAAALMPFGGLILHIDDPTHSIAMYASFVFLLCLVESTFTHILEPYLIQDEANAETNHRHQHHHGDAGLHSVSSDPQWTVTRPLVDHDEQHPVPHYDATT